MGSSIRGTLLGWYGLIVSVVVVGFGATLYGRASTTMLETIDASIVSRADALAGALEWDEEDGWEFEISYDYMAAISASARFGVWTPGGELVRRHGLDASHARGRLAGFEERDGWRELVARDSRGAVVIVAQSLKEYEQRLRGLLWGIVGASLGALAVALVGGWWLASRTLAPISRMTATAAGISD